MATKIFGLDIGRSFIKVIQVENSGGKKKVTAAASVVAPGGGIQSESAVELEKLSEVIRSCVKGSGVDTQNCAVSLIESQVVTRLIEMPNLTDKELSAAINWEAEQYIPLPIKDVSLQYQIISKAEGAGAKMNVLLIAAPKRVIDKYSTVVKKAGLHIEYLETESTALTRALSNPQDPASIIVSLGAISTELVINYAGNVLFTRSIANGGINLTKAIMSEFNLPQDQAEQYKQTYGIREDQLGGKVSAVLKPILDILIGEIQKAVEFAHSHIQNSQVNRIVVCGGGAYLPGFGEFLTQRVGLEVSLADPWMNFAKDGVIQKLPGQGSLYAVATGLALRT